MKKCLFPCLRNEEKPGCVIFFLGYFFSDNTRLFGIIWASFVRKTVFGGGGGGCFDKECFSKIFY